MILKYLKQIEKLVVFSTLFAITLGTIGGQWDLWMHVKQGHELFAPPHLMIAGQLVLLSAIGVFAAISMAFNKRALGAREKRGLCLAIFGGALIPASLIFDELWHKFLGLDQTVWSAPHALMFLGVASVFFGLLIYKSIREKQKPSLWLSPKDIVSLLFFAAILLLLMFSLLDFDNPHISERIRDSRPGFTYAISVSGINILAMLLMALIIKKVGAATIAALIAWSFYAAVVFVVATIGGFWHTTLPFPIVIPALVVDISLFFALRKSKPKLFFPIVMFAVAASFWAVIAWSSLYTKLPQQISGGLNEWLLWSFWVIPLAVIILFIAGFFTKYFLKDPA